MTNNYVERFTTEKSLRANIEPILHEKVGYQQKLNATEARKVLNKLPTNDLKLSRIIREVFEHELLYVSESATKGEWYVWDGTVWAKEESGQIHHNIVNVCADILDDIRIKIGMIVADQLKGDDDADLKDALKSLSTYIKSLSNENTAAGPRRKIQTALQKSSDHFDHDQEWIVFADGQVLNTNDLKAGLQPADPKRPVNRKMGVTLGEGAPERFIKSLDERGIPKDQQQYLKIAAGAALIGRGDAKNIVTLVGVSNTGKTSYIETLLAAFGGYGSKLPAGAIVAKTSTNFEQHKARGARFIYLEEPYEARTDDSFLKDLSGGGGLVSTQQKGRDVVEWRPQGVLHIGANHVPKINTQDDAIVKRMNIVGFNRKFTAGDGVFHKNIHQWLIEQEGPQIARWLVEGAIEYDRLGFIPVPDSIKDNAANNVAESSTSLMWLMEQFESGELVDCRNEDVLPSHMVVSDRNLYNSFRLWAEAEGIQKIPMKKTWQAEINYYMGQPPAEKNSRPGGYSRLWKVGMKLKVSDSPELNITQVAPNHGRIES